jgi:hypothetical protein
VRDTFIVSSKGHVRLGNLVVGPVVWEMANPDAFDAACPVFTVR